MDIQDWEKRYRTGERPAEDLNAAPTPLLIETARRLPPGKALDLACGTGRHALWLAERGWTVTAVDGAPAAIEILGSRASRRGMAVDARVANLETGEFGIEPARWDLIVIAYYLQRDLFASAKMGLVPGGILLAIVHLAEPGGEPAEYRLAQGELKGFFRGWEILHYYEGNPNDPAHRRSVAEIVARRPRN